MRIRRVYVLLVMAALPAGSARAQDAVNAPPGNSAVGQYLETIPAATGDRLSKSTTTANQKNVLTSNALTALAQRGSNGAQLAQFVQASGVPTTSTTGAKSGTGTGATTTRTRDPFEGSSPGSSPASSVAARSLTGADGSAGGMGAALPVVLGTIALAGIGFSLRRRPEAL